MTYLKTSNDTQNRTNDALENNAKAFQDFNRRLDDGDKAGEAMAKAIKDGFADVNKRLDGINRGCATFSRAAAAAGSAED